MGTGGVCSEVAKQLVHYYPDWKPLRVARLGVCASGGGALKALYSPIITSVNIR